MTRQFDNCRIHIRAEWPETPEISNLRVN
jgi:hypothetical protein